MKGIILAAGYGSRFLPATKTVPKEMLPLGTRPAVDYVVQEFLGAGIREILVITSRRKRALEDYFDREIELEHTLNRPEQQAAIRPVDAEIYFRRQRTMDGTGAAVLLAREFVGDDSCVLAYPDDLHFGEVPLARQLVEVHARTGDAVLALETRPDHEDISRYGVAATDGITSDPKVRGVVEKPPTGAEPSRHIVVGRYLLTPEVLRALERGYALHTTGEFPLTEALNEVAGAGGMSGCVFTGERLDTGEPDGYYRAVVRHWLQDACHGPSFREYLRSLLE